MAQASGGFIPEAAGSEFETNKRRAMELGELRAFESYYPPMDTWFEERDYPSDDGITVLFTDIGERKRSEEERERLLESTALLLEVATAATSWTDQNDMLESLGDLLLRATRRSRVVLELWDDERQEIEVAVSRGSAAIPRERFALHGISEAAGDVITTRKSAVVDYEQSVVPAQKQVYLDEHGFRLVLCVPIVYRERLVGLIVCDEPGERRPFGTQEIQLVETIAAQMGAAIENARLLEREAEEARLSGALNEINDLMHSSLDAAEIMRRVVAEAAKTVGADSVMIALKHGDDWVAEYGYPEMPGVLHERVSTDEAPFMMTAVTERRPVAIEDCANDPRCRPEVQARFGVRSVLCLPLIVRDQVLGVVFFNHHAAAARFGTHTMAFADRLASAMSSALGNAAIYAAQQRIAATLQENFVHPLPELPGLEFGLVYPDRLRAGAHRWRLRRRVRGGERQCDRADRGRGRQGGRGRWAYRDRAQYCPRLCLHRPLAGLHPHQDQRSASERPRPRAPHHRLPRGPRSSDRARTL